MKLEPDPLVRITLGPAGEARDEKRGAKCEKDAPPRREKRKIKREKNYIRPTGRVAFSLGIFPFPLRGPKAGLEKRRKEVYSRDKPAGGKRKE